MAQFEPDDLNLDTEQTQKDTSPIPFDDNDGPGTQISHSPLNLGGGGSAPAPAVKPAPKPAATQPPAAATPKQAPAPVPGPKPVTVQQAATTSAGRITGLKIFFTKLHAGAMDFLSEQISDWLKNNPNIAIKRTNVVVGEVAAKKTEQNLIVTVWY
jgi:hypothetical protein